MTDAEAEAESKRKLEHMRTVLNEHKRRWDARNKGVETG